MSPQLLSSLSDFLDNYRQHLFRCGPKATFGEYALALSPGVTGWRQSPEIH